MKVFKKLSMLFVAAAMMMTTVSTALASEGMTQGNGEVTINRDGATYTAYKILDSKNKAVSNGQNLTIYSVADNFENFFNGEPYKFDADKGIFEKNDKNEFVVVKTPSGDGLLTVGGDQSLKQSSQMKKMTEKLIQYIETNNITGDQFNGNATKELSQGYYLVLENTETISSGGKNNGRVPSLAMLMDVNPKKAVNINPKDATIKIDKTVDSAMENVAGVGDVLNFEITSTIPTYADNYKNIKYNIYDEMSKGLTLNEKSIKVTINDRTVIENGVITDEKCVKSLTTKQSDGTSANMFIEFNYDELKTASLMGATVKVTYKAEINTHAVIKDPNKNEAKLEYTVNPGGSTDYIVDETETYTYGIKIFKIDGNANLGNESVKNPLAGATFNVTKVDESGNAIKKVGDITTDAQGYAAINGLGEGYYTLVETVAPNGYSKLDGAIKIKIEKDANNLENAIVTLVDANGDIANLDVNATKDGLINITIKNYKGINLPETGGMGTTIFMIGGATLITLAGAMLFIYSKKSKKA